MAMPVALSERQVLETRFKNARNNLLVVAAFTLINVLLLLTNSGTYFLFSAYIPYLLVDLGMYWCGKYPAEFYADTSETEFLDPSVFTAMVVVAGIVLALYLLCFLLSKKNKNSWLVFALMLFAADTAIMFWCFGIQMEMLMDIVFHGWVLMSLVMGVIACRKLKKLPAETAEASETEAITAEESDDDIDDIVDEEDETLSCE